MPGGKINYPMHVERYFYKLTEKNRVSNQTWEESLKETQTCQKWNHRHRFLELLGLRVWQADGFLNARLV